MKRILRIFTGIILALCGLAIVALGIFYVVKGQFIWLVILLAGGAVAIAGVRIATGDKMRDIIEDLLSVLIRTN